MIKLNRLIEKYNRPAPRYTSYPPVPFWRHGPTEEKWVEHLKNHYDDLQGIDLYVHVPFCESLCYYCGCNRTITKDHSLERKLLDLLKCEWEIYKDKLGFSPKINSIHFGGGTPTFLNPNNLRELILTLVTDKTANFVGSIEIDPRTVLEDHLYVLKELAITRLSLGIQDFDPEVQQAIHRHQSPEMVGALVKKIRECKFESLNFDLIYGLPKQNRRSIQNTIEHVKSLAPDLIAFYSYAHLPEKIKNQKLIKEADLPSPQEKREQYLMGKKLLEKSGYTEIGMDHFALPENFLSKAQRGNQLKRNFMGYVDRKSNILIGLGPTSISDSSVSFLQNAKDFKVYESAIKEGRLAIAHGHTQSHEDLVIQNLIQKLMCQHELNLDELTEIPFANEVLNEIQEFAKDDILEIINNKVIFNEEGRGFLRNVAMTLDFYSREQKNRLHFSQTI